MTCCFAVAQNGGGVIQAGFGVDEHWIGPALIGLGQPINYLTPVGALGSSPGSSIASKTLSKAIPQTFTKTLGKEVGTKVATAVGTNVIGRALGRFVPYVGWGITIYDFTTDDKILVHNKSIEDFEEEPVSEEENENTIDKY